MVQVCTDEMIDGQC